jgi:DegV family protein with EDD domain
VVAIVTDSVASLPRDVADAAGVVIVPMYLKLGEEIYRDGVDLVGRDFYERLVRDGDVASTSAPSPGDFLETFEAAGDREIVCVTVGASVSATHHEARLAAERFDGRVELVDSGSASMAEGFVALEAARAARAGGSLEEVAARARDVAGAARLYATIDTFEFLRKSGRVNKVQAYAATMLDIKPVFRFHQGEIAPVARPRTRRRAIERIVVETVREAAGRSLHLAVFHANAEEEARDLLRRIEGEVQLVERIITEFTPVMGAHAGPGTVGTAFFPEPVGEGARP